jgi:lipoprotein-anchoring transpeptidase ErfK/SrfK
VASGELMTFSSGGMDGGDIVLASANGTSTQVFKLIDTALLENGYYVIWANNGQVLNVYGGSKADGAGIHTLAFNNTGAQKWYIERGSDGYYTIKNAKSLKVLDIPGAAANGPIGIWQYAPNGSAAQKWLPEPSGDGNIYFKSGLGTYLALNSTSVISSVMSPYDAMEFLPVATTYSYYDGTYADVNLTTQWMYFVKDDERVLDSPIVSGAPWGGRSTPTGTYYLLGKASPTVLVGADYRQPVDYWMRIVGGVGFHDATWQPTFGGSWYLNNGSHGCINMPYDKAQQLYSLIRVGDKVVIHY